MVVPNMEGTMASHKFLFGARASWWMKLDHDATLAVADGAQRHVMKAYALLHDNGSIMHDEEGPLVSDSWPTICQLASRNSSLWVLLIGERRVIRLKHGKNGAYVDTNSVLLSFDDTALQSLTQTDHTYQEIEREEAISKAGKRPSGAEHRRRRRSGV